MDNSGPSRTALATAYARAYHQFADRPRILTDPLAALLLGVTAENVDELSTYPADHPAAVARDRPRRLFFAARSRFADDAVTAAVARGVRQIVVLGAGLDTIAYRNTHPDVHVFEIDHPQTQSWKRERLATNGIDIPPTATLVPVDFETQALASELETTAFTRTEPAVYVWLGVLYYLTSDAARATLEYIAGQAQPVEVVFDYLQPAVTDEDRTDLRARAERLARTGEPLVTYVSPAEIHCQLADLGFTAIEDLTANELLRRYLAGTPALDAAPPRALRASRIVHARR
ncbi:class I SAM-dependent methyltransferase [Mycolicibacterium goodii]|uniref:S-adenosyl-L-methionine-dependent methyltransferase n=1 Tax=Mycolicibacterium goodii TaxID=134601 RepID=A0ABS6HWG5_MYCGD|nr:SAM-dependent methyltransferase [Mycolicibacterium goodii]MBU8826285.1 class I SAM-dependent methyltransferase [Mycolicibacterium goodii]MBU8839658.1 class I SAM-dependent methyltransferase [Mycolicibacterium goodii]